MELVNFTENLPLLLNTTAISKFQNVWKEKMDWSPRATFFLYTERKAERKRGRKGIQQHALRFFRGRATTVTVRNEQQSLTDGTTKKSCRKSS